MIAERMYPVRCPGCGAMVTDSLMSAHVPIYACGSYGDTILCKPARASGPGLANLVTPTDNDLLELARVLTPAAFAWVPNPRIGLCTWTGCDAAAVDGLCLTHG